MPNVPLTVWLGGVQATVSYQGRSGCCVGEDQIVFTVPATAPTGCAVPLLVQIGNNISNNTLMPVANGSRTCPVVNPQLAQLDAVQIEQAVSAGSVTYGSIKLAHFSDGGGVYEDDARLQFLKFTGFVRGIQPFFVSWADDQPLGTCIVYNNTNAGFNTPITGGNQLDAGSTYTLTGPNGNQKLLVGDGKLNAFNMTGRFWSRVLTPSQAPAAPTLDQSAQPSRFPRPQQW